MVIVFWARRADNLKIILNNLWGGRLHPQADMQVVMHRAFDEAERDAEAVFTPPIPFSGELDGKLVSGIAETVIARVGHGADAEWVAFVWYPGGWVNTVRPFTDETAAMVWLETYIREELAWG
jgi:hypothetical protein